MPQVLSRSLKRERTPEEYRDTLESCHEAAQTMRKLSDTPLELARCDDGIETIYRGPVPLEDCAHAVADLFLPAATRTGIKILLDLSPVTITANPERVQQIKTNLVSNAFHYNKPGGEVIITVGRSETEVLISVKDTGIGISEEYLPHIFERFYRADKSRSRSCGNVGLGLALCKAMVEAEGGTIEATSQPGSGSTFTVRFPK